MLQLNDVPKISNDITKSIKELRNYIVDLNDYLKYKLNNLEVTNFTEQSRAQISAPSTAPPAPAYNYILKSISDAVQNATELITGHQGGYVVLNPANQPSEILIMDTDNLETAVNVWRWNGAGLGFSSTGYDGTYSLAITMDGSINANFITSGKITALEIDSATISGGTININDNFIVNADGDVSINGAITWGAATSPVTVQYSINGSTLWHDTFTAGDTFAKYSYDGGTTYTSAVKIIGTDGAIGPAGTDGSDGVSAYTYIRYSEQSDGTDFVSAPTTLTKYIGIAVTTSSTAPTDKANYTWSKYQGEDGSDANIPEYIKETYIDMRSVVSPYIIGASIQGSDYVQYPEFNGSAIYAGSTATTNNFITDDDVIKPEWFAVNNVVDIGTSVWGKDLATGRTITGITDNGNGTHTYVISGAVIPLTNNASYMSKDIGHDKLFTIYDSPWADPTTPPDDSHIVGYLAYGNKYSTNYRNILTLSTPNGSSNQLNLVSGNIYIYGAYGILLSSGNDIQISSSSSGDLIMNTNYGEVSLYSSYGDIDIHTNTGTITIDSQDDLTIKSDKAVTIGPTSSSYKMTMSNPLLKVYNNSAYRWETYEVVTGVAVGATTTLKRIS